MSAPEALTKQAMDELKASQVALEDKKAENAWHLSLGEKQRLNAIERAAELDAAKANLYVSDGKGGKQTEWAALVARADHVISEAVNAYSDWRSAMMSCLQMFGELNSAINHSLRVSAIIPAKKYLLDEKIYPALDYMLSKKPELVLPALKHCVSLGEDGALKTTVANYRNIEGNEELNQCLDRLNKCFNKGVLMWLAENNCRPEAPGSDKIVNSEGRLLTPAEFNTMKNDPEKGLDAFLKRDSGLIHQEVAGPSNADEDEDEYAPPSPS